MRSTIPPTSRRTACAITPATWRWCARAAPASRSCWPRRRPRSRPRSMRGAAATPACICPSGSAASICPRSRRSICAPKARRAAASSRRGSPRRCGRARTRRAGASVPQSARLCAAHAVPRLRLSARMPELRRLAGRSPLPPPAGLPPLRLLDAAAGAVPAMPGGGLVRRRRPGRRAAGAGGGGAVSASRILVLSSDLVESVERLREELDDVAQGRFDIVIGTQLVAKGHHFPKLNLVGVIDADLGLATATRARPSARSNCCIRSPAAPAARRAAASATCRRISPSTR